MITFAPFWRKIGKIFSEIKKGQHSITIAILLSLCSASGNRTRVSAVRGPRPRPLDECAIIFLNHDAKVDNYFNSTNSFAKKLFLLPL